MSSTKTQKSEEKNTQKTIINNVSVIFDTLLIVIERKWNVTQYEMSLNMECHSN